MKLQLEEIDQQISDYQQQLAEKFYVKSRLPSVKVQLEKKEKELKELSKRLKKEQKDVKKLETFTLQCLWARATKSIDEKLDKERREAIEAEWKYDEARGQIDLLKEDQGQLTQKLNTIEHAEQKVEKLLEMKLQMILNEQAYHPMENELKQHYEEKQRIQIELKETKEAQNAAKDYLQCVKRLVDQLNSASNWGTADLIGGGMISSMVKHQHLDNVRQSIQSLKYHQQKLNKELQDIGQSLGDENLGISSFEHFADVFFDNIFTDISVQRKIDNSLTQARKAQIALQKMLNNLESKLNSLQAQISHQENYLRKLITQAPDSSTTTSYESYSC